MLFIYGNYSVTWTLSGSGSPAPVVTTDVAALSDGRSGSVTGFMWGGGAQSTGSYVQLSGAFTSPLEASPRAYGIGLVNIVGLPAGTLVDIGGGTQTQRLVAGRRGELNAWLLPSFDAASPIVIRIYNNVNGVASIAALAEFAIGEIIVGRLCKWPLLIASSPPQEEIVDSTQYERSSGNQLWQLMRKPISQITGKLAYLDTDGVMGGSLSPVNSGEYPSGTIDARTFMYLLSTAPVCAVCAVPFAFNSSPSNASAQGIVYDVNYIQQNFMLARPTNLQPIAMDQPPYWSWGGTFQEAT